LRFPLTTPLYRVPRYRSCSSSSKAAAKCLAATAHHGQPLNATVDRCTNGTCIFEHADWHDDELPFACLHPDELRSYVVYVELVVHWAVQVASKAKCMRDGGKLYSGCVSRADAQSMALCMYGESVRFLFE